jgi:MraZ protein
MFFGSFQYALDDKGRLVIPAKLRGECGSGLFAMRGFESCLSLFPASAFEKLIQQVQQLDYTQNDVRQYVRTALASVIELTIDDHGRIQLPTETLKKYNLTKHVKIIGVHDHLELWDAETWDTYERSLEGTFEANAATVNKK